MVQKTAEQISALEKENAEMKKKLTALDDNRKISNFIESVVWTVILWWIVSALVIFAEYGAEATAVDENMSLLGAALLTTSVIIIGLILKVYVVYRFVVNTIFLFQNELNTGGVKAGIFLKAAIIAGRQALQEAKAKEAEQAEGTQEPTQGEPAQPKRDAQKTPAKGAGKKENAGTPVEEVKVKEDPKTLPPA